MGFERLTPASGIQLIDDCCGYPFVLGCSTLWAEQTFHVAISTFWGLLALIHWFDVRGPWHSIAGPIINTIPFALSAVAGLPRKGENS